jgi:uncharacterized protein
MKLLITSDVHGRHHLLDEVIQKHPDIHHHINAGDMCLNQSIIDRYALITVKGNNDFYSEAPTVRVLKIDTLDVLLTHGHLERVKMGLEVLKHKAKSHQVSLCVFGHTHQRYLNAHEGIIYVNPGSLGDGQKSYAIYEDGQVTFHEL